MERRRVEEIIILEEGEGGKIGPLVRVIHSPVEYVIYRYLFRVLRVGL
jgi:hypothetical protein